MKINEQYHNLNLLENVTYEFLGRDGETHEETEPILVEHMMDVYVNERLTMKLVCIPQHLTELVLGRLFTEGIISSAEDVEQIYICEFGKRARVILSKNKSGQSHEENEDYVALTPTCCTGNRVLNDYFITDQPMTPVTPVPWKKQWIFDLADCFANGTPLHSQTLYHVRDMFLFSCFTGIPYGDMRLLTKDNLCLAEDGIWWIKSARQKTKIEFEIPLLDLPLQILKKYSGTAPGDKLLPMYCNSTLNLYLKEIARICHIDRPVACHAGRHTYATEITLSHGVPLETVSRMLGHSQIETTQIYAKVTDEKIDADTKALNRKISERFSVVI